MDTDDTYFTSDEAGEIDNALTVIETILARHTYRRTKDDMKRETPIAKARIPFVEQASLSMEQHPEWLPHDLDQDQVRRDAQEFRLLDRFERRSRAIAGMFSEDRQIVSSAYYGITNAYYKSVKDGARRGSMDARRIVEGLSPLVSQGRPAKKHTPPEPPSH